MQSLAFLKKEVDKPIIKNMLKCKGPTKAKIMLTKNDRFERLTVLNFHTL